MASVSYLILEKGSIYKGQSFGAAGTLTKDLKKGIHSYTGAGELVFNTAMSGYYETLTDPSYTGQIIAMCYPHIGNYGTDPAWNESGPEGTRPKRPVKASGYVCRSVYRGPVPEGRGTLDAWLASQGIPGVSEIDTRRLTLELRDGGSQNAVIVAPEDGVALSDKELATAIDFLKAFPRMEGLNLIGDVGIPLREKLEPREGNGEFVLGGDDLKGIAPGLSVAVIDYGAKANIVNELLAAGCEVTLYPSDCKAAEVLAGKHHGVLLSNGPGDPAVLHPQIETIKGLMGKIPLTAICLGHQLIACALGAKTFKMKFGHHGINHPVRDERSKKVFVTSQNHGFAVDETSLPRDVEVWFRNANDQSVEGLISESRGIWSAQFHPESAPGPHDSLWIFAAFLRAMSRSDGKKVGKA